MVTRRFTGRGQLINRLSAQVGSRKLAISILQKRGHVDKHGKLTPEGEKRDRMTAGERAIDREAKASGNSPRDYKYNASTNRATLKEGK